MFIFRLIRILCTLCALSLLLSGCLSLPQPYSKNTPTPPAEISTDKKGQYKVGKPYNINGKWYYPKVDHDYDKTGLASWYGPNFHNKLTANGEVFDQWAVSAAHKTLPMPSMVRVTNLENGRSIVLRINDRGPFVDDRIIDLSREAARLLGMEKQGVAQVRVNVMEASENSSEFILPPVDKSESLPKLNAQPTGGVVVARDIDQPNSSDTQVVQPSHSDQPSQDVTTNQVSEEFTQLEPNPGKIYVQIGAFTIQENAQRLGKIVRSYGLTDITPVSISDQTFYRVRIGPIDDVEYADHLIKMLDVQGVKDAHIVID